MICPDCNHEQIFHFSTGCIFHNNCECENSPREIELLNRITELETAGRRLVNNLPEDTIEEAREVWLNTNTRIILEARNELAKLLKD